MINSFVIFSGISTSQTLPGPPQQVTVEDGARGAKPAVLTCVCLFPGLGRGGTVSCVPALGGCLPTAYRHRNLSGISHVLLDCRGGFTKHEEPCCTKGS